MSNTTEPVEQKYNYARATSGNTIKGAWVNPTVAACRTGLRERIEEGRRALEKTNGDGQNFELIKLLNGVAAQIEADDALVLKLHNATGAAR